MAMKFLKLYYDSKGTFECMSPEQIKTALFHLYDHGKARAEGAEPPPLPDGLLGASIATLMACL